MRRTARLAPLLAVTVTAVIAAAPHASARPATPFSYDVSYDDFAVCGQDATLEGRVFLGSRSTGAQNGNYSATFVERTTGTLTIGEETYQFHQASHFSELEAADGETRTERLSGWIRLAGSGSFAGTKLEQRIHTVVDANGVTRVETYLSSFCS